MPTAHPVAITCTVVLAILLFGLGSAVSVARLKGHQLIGVTDNADALLNRLVRAHGNTAEYAPMLVVLFLALGVLAPSVPALVCMVLATASRVLFVVGMLSARTLSRPNPVRFSGALGTYVFGLALALMLFRAV